MSSDKQALRLRPMKQEKNKIQVWLDKLQQESWQLELIISSILLLIIGSYDDTIPDLILRYKTLEGFSFAYVICSHSQTNIRITIRQWKNP